MYSQDYRWSILVDLMSRILMVVVLTIVDGWWVRIDDLKLRWPTKIAPFFRPDGEVNTLTMAGVLLCRRLETFLWRCGGFRRPEMGDQRRERESPARGERGSGIWRSQGRSPGTIRPLASFLAFYHRAGHLEQLDLSQNSFAFFFTIGQVSWNH